MAPTPGSTEDAALGAVLGAFVGDAAGAVLEFKQTVSLREMQHALTFPGGGVHCVGRGQITDDSEMALCLARGLRTATPPAFPAAAVADQYVNWAEGPPPPFDMGTTTITALGQAAAAKFRAGANEQEVLRRMLESSKEGSQESKANGALMRASPLAVWGHRLSAERLAAAARADCRLTHPNQSCQDASAAYIIATATLIRRPGDAEGAAAAADVWAKENACQEVRGWLEESREPGPGPDCDQLIGFVRWGFVHAFRMLRRGTRFEGAVEAILLRGGDTDTNAAIVGGLLGALWGASNIPAAWREAVLGRTAASAGIPRPEWLLPGPQLPGLVGELLALARDGDAGGDSAAGGSGDADAAVEKAKQEAAEQQAKQKARLAAAGF